MNSRLLRPLFGAIVLLGAAVGQPSAQERQRAAANGALFREPGGLRLGNLVAGFDYRIGRIDRTWIALTIEGWIPASSAETTKRDGFDLIVTSGDGEAVRAAPAKNGAIVARVQEGTLLSRTEARGQWLRIRRQGWVSRAELAAAPTPSPVAPTPSPAARAPTPAAAPPRPPAPAPAPAAATTSPPKPDPRAVASASAVQESPAAGDSTGTGLVSLKKGARLATAPDGEELAQVSRPGTGAVVERSRDWVKVRIEGWVRIADVAGLAEPGPKLTGAMIRTQPDKYIGQDVAWRLQFLAVQEADDLRPEMPRGQLYLLTRGPLPESGFVYVMVNKAQADQYGRLQPLDEIRVEGVLKAGRTKYLPTPVVELK